MIAASLLALATLPSTPDLGKQGSACRPNESGPSFIVDVIGLKDRVGQLKLELYPDNDTDLLADDNILIQAGKAFRRIEVPIPSAGPVTLCIRAPAQGSFALMLLHDRDGNHKFGLSVDGIGFSGNPKLGWAKPKAETVGAVVGNKPARVRIVLNYRHGLFSFRPE